MTAPLVFQKKPKRVRAMRYDNTTESAEKIRDWCGGEGVVFQLREPHPLGGYIFELIAVDGIPSPVYPGWWIVRHEKGAFQVYGDSVFEAWYERVLV